MVDKYVAFIPVRGGSKSIPFKNIKPICGKPLVFWTIDAAVQCDLIHKIYIATDSCEIKNLVNTYIKSINKEEKVFCIDRDPQTATDTASTESAMLEFAQKYVFQNIVLIQATSPLLRTEDLTQAIESYNKHFFDSLLSVVRQKRFVWKQQSGVSFPVNYDYNNRPRRQEFEGYLVENGAFYITSRKALLSSLCRLSGKIGTYVMDEVTYFEIDEPSDWIIVENLLKKRQKKKLNKNIKLFVTDCDGVLTDGGMYYSENGDEMKKFNTKDGMGFSLLRKANIKTAIISGEDRKIIEDRAMKLNVDYIFMGAKDKITLLKSLIDELDITMQEVAYIGDDINDIECIQAAGLGFTVKDAVNDILEVADIVLPVEGGKGAVREAIEYILY